MRRHSENSLALAQALRDMPGVAAVHHPLLEDSPSFAVARRLLPDGAGGMMAFDLEGGRAAVQRMMSRFQHGRRSPRASAGSRRPSRIPRSPRTAA